MTQKYILLFDHDNGNGKKYKFDHSKDFTNSMSSPISLQVLKTQGLRINKPSWGGGGGVQCQVIAIAVLK